jgi:hypothetical protein
VSTQITLAPVVTTHALSPPTATDVAEKDEGKTGAGAGL